MPLKIFSLVSLLFLASITRVIPTHLFKFLIFKYSSIYRLELTDGSYKFPDISTCKCGVVRDILLFENVSKAQAYHQLALGRAKLATRILWIT